MAIRDISRPCTTSTDCVHDYETTTKQPLKTS